MDLHKPKPWHGVREFLKEYVIIVVGVLTALAAEQGVEWLHWRHVVAQTEAALHAETEDNLIRSYDRMVIRPCISARVAELRDRLAAPGSAWRASRVPANALLTMPEVVNSITSRWQDAAWQTAVSGDGLNHMAPERAHFYAELYRGFQMMRDFEAQEQAARPRLTALAFDRTLTEPEKAEYLNVLGELDHASTHMVTDGRQLLQSAASGGIKLKASQAQAEARREQTVPGRESCARAVAIPTSPG